MPVNPSAIRAGWVPFLIVAGITALFHASPGFTFEPDIAEYRQQIIPILRDHCFGCHGPQRQESSLRIDTLPAAFTGRDHTDRWHEILNMLHSGKMPPEDAAQPSDEERGRLTNWITVQLQRAADSARRSRTGRRPRRLTVHEYNRTMQSLFGVQADFARTLPPDPISADGYRNDLQLLTISALQMEYYLEIARTAVSRYVVFDSSRSKTLRYHIEVEDLYYTVRDRYETCKRAPEPLSAAAFADRRHSNSIARSRFSTPLSPLPPGDLPAVERLRPSQPKLHEQFIPIKSFPDVGDVIIRVKAAASPGSTGSVPRLRVACGMAYGDGDGMDAHILGEADVTSPVRAPAVYEFRGRIEDITRPEHPGEVDSVFDMLQLFLSNVSRDSTAIYDLGMGSLPDPRTPSIAKDSKKRAAARRQRADVDRRIAEMAAAGVNLLHLDSVEIELVPHDSSRNGLRWQVQRGDQPRAAARDLLARFMPQAYRREVSSTEIDSKLKLFDQLSGEGHSFETSVRETLVSVLVSPHFLFLEAPSPAGQHAQPSNSKTYRLASRLSYFLWATMPDERLLEAARSGKLVDTDSYAREAARMLDDDRSRGLVENFCRQWLRLDRFPLVAVNPEYYPDYDDDLAEDTIRESIAFFAEVFYADRSARELIDANFAMLNSRLAEHYELPSVNGGELRKVDLPVDSVRGGLLTQAATLTMNSDGVDSHPIRRGVWILHRLLNDPPPAPPPNVPDIDEQDPQFQGLSLKQQIELHRKSSACIGCHQQIDPWGIALENFDAIGRFRDQMSIRREQHTDRREVDASTKLPDGTSIGGIRELKQYMIQERSKHFTHSLVHHMLTYALGRRLDVSDQSDAELIHKRFAESGYRLRELVLAIAESPTFRR